MTDKLYVCKITLEPQYIRVISENYDRSMVNSVKTLIDRVKEDPDMFIRNNIDDVMCYMIERIDVYENQ